MSNLGGFCRKQLIDKEHVILDEYWKFEKNRLANFQGKKLKVNKYFETSNL